MHQAIPYRSWHVDLHSPTSTPLPLNSVHSMDNKTTLLHNRGVDKGTMVLNMVAENAVIVVGRRGCCMSHVVKRLLLGLGVNPAVHEVDEDDEDAVATELEAMVVGHNDQGANNNKVQFPAVFIGGKLFGGLERLMATHISGELVPTLKQAGALWL